MSDDAFKAVISAKDEMAAPIAEMVKHCETLFKVFQKLETANLGTPAVDAKREFSGLAGILERNALKPLEGLNKAAKDAWAPMHNLHSVILKIDEASHFAGLREGLRGAFEWASKLMSPMELLAGGGAAAGLFEMAKKASEYGDQLQLGSERTGVSAQDLAVYTYGAKQKDVSTDTLYNSLGRLNRVIGDAFAGKNKEAAAMFHKLGISLDDGTKHAISAAQAFPLLSEAIQRNTDQDTRNRIAAEAFGRAGAELIPMMVDGKEAFEEWKDAAVLDGLIPTKEQLKRADDFKKALTSLEGAFQGVEIAIGDKVGPIATKDMKSLTTFLQKHRDWIADNVAGLVNTISNMVTNHDWDKLTKVNIDWAKVEKNIDAMGAALVRIGDIIGTFLPNPQPAPAGGPAASFAGFTAQHGHWDGLTFVPDALSGPPAPAVPAKPLAGPGAGVPFIGPMGDSGPLINRFVGPRAGAADTASTASRAAASRSEISITVGVDPRLEARLRVQSNGPTLPEVNLGLSGMMNH